MALTVHGELRLKRLSQLNAQLIGSLLDALARGEYSNSRQRPVSFGGNVRAANHISQILHQWKAKAAQW